MVSQLKVLVVEDQVMIAMDVELILYDNGAQAVETAASCELAIEKLASFRPDVAILDINLGTGTSLPVAEILLDRRIPFIFATGYGDSSMLPETMAAAVILQKPFEATALTRALADAVAASAIMR
jgi:DNA-binding NtrC family response regulator